MRVFGLLLLCLTFPLFAGTQLVTQIYDVDYGKAPGEETLVLLTSGHVAKLRTGEKLLSSTQKMVKNDSRWYEITLDNDRFITLMKPSSKKGVSIDKNAFHDLKSVDNAYVPTTVASMEVAKSYHREARRTTKEETQCFNRAMVWSYEWWLKHSLKSNKILIFFTRNYIRRYNFEWWFHIAPYLHVMENGKVVERVMDVKYTRGPIPFRKWTDIFMKKDDECPVITKYSEYADYPYTGECYIMRTSMYTYQPADLQMNEAWGYTKDRFNMDEVRGAYLEAYDITL